MTDAELIARLRDEHVAASRNEAADRIEALIAERDDALGEWDKAIVLADKAAALMNKMDTRRIAAEAKLAKAVEALLVVDALDPESLVGGCSRDALSGLVNRMGDKARATLAEIKGENHE